MKLLLTTDATQQIADVLPSEKNGWSWAGVAAYFQDAMPAVLDFLVTVVIALVVLLIGRKIIKVCRNALRRFMERTDLEQGVVQFLDHFLNVGLHFLLIMLILSKFGVTASSVIALIGSVGLSIGLALQGSLSNFAGGVLILLLKPFKVGDYIKEDERGNEGTVTEIQLFYTKLLTIDNRTVILPNGTLSNSSLVNLTHQGVRRIHIVVGISYNSDILLAKQILQDIAEKDVCCLQNEPIQVFVDELASSSVNMGLRVSVKPENYLTTRWRLLEEIKLCFDREGIKIPYPQMEVTMREES